MVIFHVGEWIGNKIWVIKVFFINPLMPFNGVTQYPMPQITGKIKGWCSWLQTCRKSRPLVAEIFPDCGRINAGIPFRLWKIKDWILGMFIFVYDYCGNTSIRDSEWSKSAWYLVISSFMLKISWYCCKLRMSKLTHFCRNFSKSKIWSRKDSNLLHVWMITILAKKTSFLWY